MPWIPDEIISSWFGNGVQPLSITDRIPIVAMAFLFLMIGYSIGRGLLATLRLPQLPRAEHDAYCLGLGLSILSTYTLVVGLIGGLHSRVAVLAPVYSAALVSFVIWRRGHSPYRATAEKPPAWSQRWPIPLIGSCLLIIFLGALLPPWEFDVCEYHLQAPKEWFQNGRIGFMPHNIYANMPMGSEMHSLLAMVAFWGDDGWWSGAMVGKTVIATFTLATAVLVYSITARLSSPAAGRIAALVYVSVPWVAQVSMAGLIDGVLAFYTLATLSALDRWRNSVTAAGSSAGAAPRSWLLLAGAMAGSAIATKYPAVVMLVLPALVGVFVTAGAIRQRLSAMAIFVMATAIFGGGWYAKNYWQTGNPTYPLAYSLWGGETRTDAKDQQWRRAHQDVDSSGRTYSADQFLASLQNLTYRSDWLSPILLPLAAIGILSVTNRSRIHWLVFPLVYVALWWLCTHRIDRFWLPIVPVLSVLAGLGAVQFSHVIWMRFITGLLVLVTGLVLAVISWRHPGAFADNQFFVKLETLREQYSHPVHRWLNDQYRLDLQRQQESPIRVLLVGDAQPFDLRMPNRYNTCFDDSIFEQLIRAGSTREDRLQRLKLAGITHVFVDWDEIQRYRSTYGFTEFVTPNLVRDELVRDQGIFEAIHLDVDFGRGELFRVVNSR